MSHSTNAAPVLHFNQVSVDVRKLALKHFEHMNSIKGGKELRKNYIVGINLTQDNEAVVFSKDLISVFEEASPKANFVDFWTTLTWSKDLICDRKVKPVLLEVQHVSDEVMEQTLDFVMKNNQKYNNENYEVVGWADGQPMEGMSLATYLSKIKNRSSVETDFYVKVGSVNFPEPTATFNASEENVIFEALKKYLETDSTASTESTIKSTLKKFSSVWMSPGAKNKSLMLSLGEKVPTFSEEHGSAEDGIIWAVEKGLKQEQALRLREKITQALPGHATPSQRRKAFIDEVNFFIELMDF